MLELERRESGKSPEFPGEIGIADLGRVDAGQASKGRGHHLDSPRLIEGIEVVVVAAEAVAFVIAFGATLAVGWRAVVVAGLVIVLIWAFFLSVVAKVSDAEIFVGVTPEDAFLVALVIGLPLYAGWALGVGAATLARSWAARRG